MPIYFYNDFESSDDPDDSYRLDSAHDSPEWVAESAADDYYSNHDGWEAIWPVVLILWDEHKKCLGKFEVEREAVPQFTAIAVY